MVRKLFLVFCCLASAVAAEKTSKSSTKRMRPQESQELPEEEFLIPLTLEEIDLATESPMALITGGDTYLGSQFFLSGAKIAPVKVLDGAKPRRKVHVKSFYLDEHTVTNKQFAKYVKDTEYVTEAEKFGWSFVLETFVSPETLAETEAKDGLGRVKDAPHWLGVKGASWGRPFGPDSTFAYFAEHPVVHISYNDALDYCSHYGKRLPSEKEWEYVARNGYINASYPWGNDTYVDNQFNLWQGKFPKQNTREDGFVGTAPVKSFDPNSFGVYNLLGNVWEWVTGGTPEKRTLRGGSFLDSKDGSFNHIVVVSTKQVNGGDSGANNIGFRCAKSLKTTETVAEETDELTAEKRTEKDKKTKREEKKTTAGAAEEKDKVRKQKEKKETSHSSRDEETVIEL